MGIISPNLSLDLRAIIYMLVYTKPSLQRQISLFIQTYIAVATLTIVPLELFNRKITYSFKSQSRHMFDICNITKILFFLQIRGSNNVRKIQTSYRIQSRNGVSGFGIAIFTKKNVNVYTLTR